MTDERIAAIEARHQYDDAQQICRCMGLMCEVEYVIARLREVEARHDLLFAGAEAVAAEAERLQQRLREVEKREKVLVARLREVEQERDVMAVNAAADRRAFGVSSKRLLAQRDAARAAIARYEERVPAIIERADTAEIRLSQALAREKALAGALRNLINEVGSRYDDQWAVGGVLLADLDDARAALAAHDGAAP